MQVQRKDFFYWLLILVLFVVHEDVRFLIQAHQKNAHRTAPPSPVPTQVPTPMPTAAPIPFVNVSRLYRRYNRMVVIKIDPHLDKQNLAKKRIRKKEKTLDQCSVPCRFATAKDGANVDAVVRDWRAVKKPQRPAPVLNYRGQVDHNLTRVAQMSPLDFLPMAQLTIALTLEAKTNEAVRRQGLSPVPVYDLSTSFDSRSTTVLNYFHEHLDQLGPEWFFARGGNVEEWLKNSNKYPGICAFNSGSCNLGGRIQFLNALKKYVPVYQFGKCAKGSARQKPPALNRTWIESLPNHTPFGHATTFTKRAILSMCRFYAALENTEQDDYVSEKFYEGFVVPGPAIMIYRGTRSVLGDFDFGYLHAKNYTSAHVLGQYLKQLNTPEAFAGYWAKWRNSTARIANLRRTINAYHQDSIPEAACKWCAKVAEIKMARNKLARLGLVPALGVKYVRSQDLRNFLKQQNLTHPAYVTALYHKGYRQQWNETSPHECICD